MVDLPPDEPFDARETRPPAERSAAFWAALQQLAAHAKAHAPAWAERLADIDPRDLDSPAALARLPVLRKSQLLERQRTSREAGGDVFAGFATVGWNGRQPHAATPARVFASPGPIYEPEGTGSDPWRMARALHAAGLRRGELLHNSFAYHFTPAGAMLEGGAHRLGCAVFPAGVGNTEQQVRALADLGAQCYGGTPSFLGILIERADALGIALPALRKAVVSGEVLADALRQRLAARGIAVTQCYASADVGLMAYETRSGRGLVVDEDVYLEIVGPDDQPLPDGEVGEVVVTVLNPAYPMIRFGTGDLSRILPESRSQPLPCGRTQLRIAGWMGRADQATKVRGLFIHPQQIHDIVSRHPEIKQARVEISRRDGEDELRLFYLADAESPQLGSALQQSVRDHTKLRAEVIWQPAWQWPAEAPTIVDLRRAPS
jgi:phenylacetate-CoA ligase